MKKIKIRLAMMCELDPSYDDRLVSEIELPDDEAEDLEPLKNESGEIVMMGSYCPLGLIYQKGKGPVAVGGR